MLRSRAPGVDYLASVAAYPRPDEKLRTEKLEVRGPCLRQQPCARRDALVHAAATWLCPACATDARRRKRGQRTDGGGSPGLVARPCDKGALRPWHMQALRLGTSAEPLCTPWALARSQIGDDGLGDGIMRYAGWQGPQGGPWALASAAKRHPLQRRSGSSGSKGGSCDSGGNLPASLARATAPRLPSAPWRPPAASCGRTASPRSTCCAPRANPRPSPTSLWTAPVRHRAASALPTMLSFQSHHTVPGLGSSLLQGWAACRLRQPGARKAPYTTGPHAAGSPARSLRRRHAHVHPHAWGGFGPQRAQPAAAGGGAGGRGAGVLRWPADGGGAAAGQGGARARRAGARLGAAQRAVRTSSRVLQRAWPARHWRRQAHARACRSRTRLRTRVTSPARTSERHVARAPLLPCPPGAGGGGYVSYCIQVTPHTSTYDHRGSYRPCSPPLPARCWWRRSGCGPAWRRCWRPRTSW
jgi:hypothetical protein